MKRTAILLVIAAGAAAMSTQAQTKPATTATKTTTAKTATTAAKTATASKTATNPDGPPAIHGIVKSAFSLRYEDIKIGTGTVAEPNKIYTVKYTGWVAATGVKFDTWENNRRPQMKDGKPVLGADGKPVLGDPQPLEFPQGFGRLIPGFDQGFAGMRVGGKRRLFIPWQLAYGTRDIPARGEGHSGIPAKSNLIFDVELVDVKDMPAPPQRPAGVLPHPVPPPTAKPATPGAPAAAPAPATAPAPAIAPAAAKPAAPAAPAQPAMPTTAPQAK